MLRYNKHPTDYIFSRSLPILLQGTQLTDAEIHETFEQLGPTPCFIRLLSQPHPLEEYKNVDMAISEITPDQLKKLVSDTRPFCVEIQTDKGV